MIRCPHRRSHASIHRDAGGYWSGFWLCFLPGRFVANDVMRDSSAGPSEKCRMLCADCGMAKTGFQVQSQPKGRGWFLSTHVDVLR